MLFSAHLLLFYLYLVFQWFSSFIIVNLFLIIFFVAFFSFFLSSIKNYSDDEIRKYARKSIVSFTKNHFSEVFDEEIFPDIDSLCDDDYFKTFRLFRDVIIVFTEMIKEGILKPYKCIKEFIKDISSCKEEMYSIPDFFGIFTNFRNEMNEFTEVAKENGFEDCFPKSEKKEKVKDIFDDWKELCKNVYY